MRSDFGSFILPAKKPGRPPLKSNTDFDSSSEEEQNRTPVKRRHEKEKEKHESKPKGKDKNLKLQDNTKKLDVEDAPSKKSKK